MELTNQGQDFSTILDDVPFKVQMEMAAVARKEIENHPGGDTCSCPVIEALAKLYSYGYKVVKT